MKTQNTNRKPATQTHTPAPWLFDGLARVSDHTPDHFVIHGPDGRAEVAHVYYGGCDEECASNAKLIAAAPALLKALKLVNGLAWWSENQQLSPAKMETRMRDILELSRDAIAATEGK